MLKKKNDLLRSARKDETVFYAALEPLEAAVLPAKEQRRISLLPMIGRAWEAAERAQNQRAKIWVR